MGALEEGEEVGVADGDGDGEADGGPEGVAAAYPVPCIKRRQKSFIKKEKKRSMKS